MAPPTKRQKTSENSSRKRDIAQNQENHELSHEKSSTKPPTDPRTLFVRLLHPDTTTEDLTNHFSQSYPLKHAVAVIDTDTKLCKGFGFVTFADAEDASAALKELNGSELVGKKIKIEHAQARSRGDDAEPGASKVSKPQASEEERVLPPKIIIRNLPWSVDTKEKLTKMFLPFGKIKEAILPKMIGGQLRGFGIVLLRGRNNAEKAIQSLNGKDLDGRTLAVDWAADKETWAKEKARIAQEEADNNPEGNDDVDDEADEHIGDKIMADGSDEDDDDDINGLPDLQDDDMDDDVDDESQDEDIDAKPKPDRTDTTIFIRNLPFTCTDDDLSDHFAEFGIVRYARIVYDPATEKPRGTGFVCFVEQNDAITCVKEAPKSNLNSKEAYQSQSVLQDYANDPSGRYTMDGRVLIISRAVKKEEADKLTQDGVNFRNHRDKDKRKLYLLQEGKIPSNSPLYAKLSPSEIKMRDASAKQRKTLVEGNPSLHLSLTRLAVRNIPKFMTSRELKALARQGVVEFSKDVKEERRERLSKEELARGGDEMREAERLRKVRGRGLVKQAKIVFESNEGSKIPEAEGAGRSRGYGFIEYYTHRSALMGLRWLNAHEVKAPASKDGKPAKVEADDKKKRLVVEFALENVNVVKRRQERQDTWRAGKKAADDAARAASKGKGKGGKKVATNTDDDASKDKSKSDEKLAKRQQIIQKKRMARRFKKKDRA
jgi:nucleolar protein 4